MSYTVQSYALHQRIINEINDLRKLDNIFLNSDGILYSDSSCQNVLELPISLELVTLQSIRVLKPVTITLSDINGNEVYRATPLLVDDFNTVQDGDDVVVWEDVLNKPDFDNLYAPRQGNINRPPIGEWSFRNATFTDPDNGVVRDAKFGDKGIATASLKVGSLAGIVKATAGVISASALLSSEIPALDASKITTGTFDLARIPAMPSANTIVCTTIPAMSAEDQLLVAKGTVVIESATGDTYRYSGTGSVVLNASYIQQSDMKPDWAVITNRPTLVSNWTNDAGYLTSASNVSWAKITGTPTTLAGYGITDALSTSYVPDWSAISGKPNKLAGYGIVAGDTLFDSKYLQSTSALNPANVTQSASYRFVTDTEKTTWNNKMNNDGSNAVALVKLSSGSEGGSNSETSIVTNLPNSITTNSPGANAGFTNAIDFRWYSTHWQIGGIRDVSGSGTNGFGVALSGTNLRWRTTNGTTFDYNNLEVTGTIKEGGVLISTKYQSLNSNLTALSTGQTNSLVIINGTAASGNYLSDSVIGDTILRWGSPYTEFVRLGVMSTVSGTNASSLYFSANSAGSNYNFSAPTFTEGAVLLSNKYAPKTHTHIIGDVTNLQTTLDGKASTAQLANYLPLSGGTLTGNLLGSTSYNIGASANWWGNGYFNNLYAQNNLVWHTGNLAFGGNGSASSMSRSDHSHSNYATTTGNYTGTDAWTRSINPGVIGSVDDGGAAFSNEPNASWNHPYITFGGSNIRMIQIAGAYDSDTICFRRRVDSVWTGWNQFWHAGNFNPATKSDTSHGHTLASITGTTLFDVKSYLGNTDNDWVWFGYNGVHTSSSRYAGFMASKDGEVIASARYNKLGYLNAENSYNVSDNIASWNIDRFHVYKNLTVAGNLTVTGKINDTYLSDLAWGNVINDNTDMNTPEAGGTGRSSIGTWTTETNSPFGNIWYNVINVRHRNGSGYGAGGWGGQLVWGMTGAQNRLAFRSRNSDTTWQSWYEVWHTGNLTSPASLAGTNTWAEVNTFNKGITVPVQKDINFGNAVLKGWNNGPALYTAGKQFQVTNTTTANSSVRTDVALIVNQGFEVDGTTYLEVANVKLLQERVGTPFNESASRSNANATILDQYAVNNVAWNATYYPCFRLPLASSCSGATITILHTIYNPTWKAPTIFTSNADSIYDVDGTTVIATSSSGKNVGANMRFISNGTSWHRLS